MTKSSFASSSKDAPTRLVYIAGPMRGCPHWNASAFDLAAQRWRARGWEVISPVEQDYLAGVDPRTAPAAELERLAADRAWLRRVICDDIEVVCRARAVAVLPGWQSSYGATVEVALALFLGLPVYDANTYEEVWPPPRPWALLLQGSTVLGRAVGGDEAPCSAAQKTRAQRMARGDTGAAGEEGREQGYSWEDVWRGLGDGRGLTPMANE